MAALYTRTGYLKGALYRGAERARRLERARRCLGGELVLPMGQCVGHDSATIARLGEPAICLIAEDRVTEHSSPAPLLDPGWRVRPTHHPIPPPLDRAGAATER